MGTATTTVWFGCASHLTKACMSSTVRAAAIATPFVAMAAKPRPCPGLTCRLRNVLAYTGSVDGCSHVTLPSSSAARPLPAKTRLPPPAMAGCSCADDVAHRRGECVHQPVTGASRFASFAAVASLRDCGWLPKLDAAKRRCSIARWDGKWLKTTTWLARRDPEP